MQLQSYVLKPPEMKQTIGFKGDTSRPELQCEFPACTPHFPRPFGGTKRGTRHLLSPPRTFRWKASLGQFHQCDPRRVDGSSGAGGSLCGSARGAVPGGVIWVKEALDDDGSWEDEDP